MPTPSISADNPASADASPAERIALILCGLLPAGSELAVCWRDWALGNGSGATPGARPSSDGGEPVLLNGGTGP